MNSLRYVCIAQNTVCAVGQVGMGGLAAFADMQRKGQMITHAISARSPKNEKMSR